MFGYKTLEDIRDLEVFLLGDSYLKNTKNSDAIPKKETFVQNIRNYFTGNSNVWYTYKYDNKTNTIKYSLPRTFSQDIKNVGEYFSRLIKNN